MSRRVMFYRWVGWLLVILAPISAVTFGLGFFSRGDLMIIFGFLTVAGLQLLGMADVIEEAFRQ